jgi:hypothetical protein
MSKTFKLENGEKEYENRINAVKVAKAKASANDKTVTVYQKQLREFTPVMEVTPDGSENRLDN